MFVYICKEAQAKKLIRENWGFLSCSDNKNLQIMLSTESSVLEKQILTNIRN